jgi:hypothetical protein
MKPALKKLIRVAAVENHPLRFVGFRALFVYKLMAGLKGLNPSVRMIATGNGQGDEMALCSLCGAKGFVDESAR